MKRKTLTITALAAILAAGVFHATTSREASKPDIAGEAKPAYAAPVAARAPDSAAVPIEAKIATNLPVVAKAAVVPVSAVFPGMPAGIQWMDDFPVELTLAVDPSHPVNYRLQSTEFDGGRQLWRMARSDGSEGRLLATTDSNGGVDMMEYVNGDEISISVRGDTANVGVLPDMGTCGIEATAASAVAEIVEGVADIQAAGVAADEVAYDEVLFLYNPEAVSTIESTYGFSKDGRGWLTSQCYMQVDSTNWALENSGVSSFRFRAITVLETPAYTRTGKMIDDLNVISSYLPKTDAEKFVYDKVREFGADHVVLFTGGDADYGGLAFVGGTQAIVAAGAGFKTTAHELGHNLGLQHDRKTIGIAQSSGTSNIDYGHRFTYAETYDMGDIMSYASYRFPLYSNPNKTVKISDYFISAYGIPGGEVTMGVPKGQDGAADGATYITTTGPQHAAFRASVLTQAPIVMSEPSDTATKVGRTVTLSVKAGGSLIKYQWRKNGVDIAGATSNTLDVTITKESDAASYTCVIVNGIGRVTTSVAKVTVQQRRTVPTATTTGKLVNLSTRAWVGTGDDVLIGGVVINGRATLLVRAVGPTLIPMGLPTALPDPILTGFTSTGTQFVSGDDWGTETNADEIKSAMSQTGAFGLADTSKDAALLLTLDAGQYTFHVHGKGTDTGVVLLEIYLVQGTGLPGSLVNISTRGKVGTGNDVMIAGFVTEGETPVLIRGVGPTLTQWGLNTALVAPTISLNKAGNLVDFVEEWGATYMADQASSLFSALGAFGLAAGSRDSIEVGTLNGTYTAIIRGDSDGTGLALAEVYLIGKK